MVLVNFSRFPPCSEPQSTTVKLSPHAVLHGGTPNPSLTQTANLSFCASAHPQPPPHLPETIPTERPSHPLSHPVQHPARRAHSVGPAKPPTASRWACSALPVPLFLFRSTNAAPVAFSFCIHTSTHAYYIHPRIHACMHALHHPPGCLPSPIMCCPSPMACRGWHRLHQLRRPTRRPLRQLQPPGAGS